MITLIVLAFKLSNGQTFHVVTLILILHPSEQYKYWPNPATFNHFLRKHTIATTIYSDRDFEDLHSIVKFIMTDFGERFTFFLGYQYPFSNFHSCSFYIDGQAYNCSEQYFMEQKACKYYKSP